MSDGAGCRSESDITGPEDGDYSSSRVITRGMFVLVGIEVGEVLLPEDSDIFGDAEDEKDTGIRCRDNTKKRMTFLLARNLQMCE